MTGTPRNRRPSTQEFLIDAILPMEQRALVLESDFSLPLAVWLSEAAPHSPI